MDSKDRIKDITFKDEAHSHIAEGVHKIAEAVGSTYGPGGRNVLTQKRYVAPIITRDGVAVAREIAGMGNKLRHPIENAAAQLVYQASEKTNKTAGDGTTATVVLLASLYAAGRKRVTAGDDPMVVRRKIYEARKVITDFITAKSKKCDKKMLDMVAAISCGDAALGNMVSDLVYDMGHDGAITISYQNAPLVEVEKVTGYLFNQGFRALSQEVEYDSPLVFVTQKRLASRGDIIPVLELMLATKQQVIIVGDVSGAALDTLIGAISQGKVDGMVVPPPAYGQDGHDYFEDIAIYTGANLWLENMSFKDLKPEDLGTLKSARVSRDKAILFGNNETGDAIAGRIAAIEQQLARPDMTPSLKEQLDERRAKLAGKVAIIRVGAVTEAAREELFYRVEDAVEACKSALSSGIVAGGATTLLFASQDQRMTPKEAKEAGYSGGGFGDGIIKLPTLEPFIKEALQAPIRLLFANAAEDGGYYLNKILEAGYGKGYNLREIGKEPEDLYKSGIVDPTKVVLQTVENAFENAGQLLTTGAVITDEVADEAKTNS